MKIKNRPDYLFHDNVIVNIKDFDSSLLKLYNLSFKGVFSLNIYYIKDIPTKSPDRVSIDRTDNGKNYLDLFLVDVDEYIEESDEKVFSFSSYGKKIKNNSKITKNFGKKLKNKLE